MLEPTTRPAPRHRRAAGQVDPIPCLVPSIRHRRPVTSPITPSRSGTCRARVPSKPRPQARRPAFDAPASSALGPPVGRLAFTGWRGVSTNRSNTERELTVPSSCPDHAVLDDAVVAVGAPVPDVVDHGGTRWTGPGSGRCRRSGWAGNGPAAGSCVRRTSGRSTRARTPATSPNRPAGRRCTAQRMATIGAVLMLSHLSGSFLTMARNHGRSFGAGRGGWTRKRRVHGYSPQPLAARLGSWGSPTSSDDDAPLNIGATAVEEGLGSTGVGRQGGRTEACVIDATVPTRVGRTSLAVSSTLAGLASSRWPRDLPYEHAPGAIPGCLRRLDPRCGKTQAGQSCRA